MPPARREIPHGGEVVVEQPVAVAHGAIEEHEDLASADSTDLDQPVTEIRPVVQGQRPHDRIEGPVDEWQAAGDALHRRRRAGRPLADHRHRGLEGDDPTVARLVVARAGADVQHRDGLAKRGGDLRCDSRVSLAGPGVGATDLVVGRHGRTLGPLDDEPGELNYDRPELAAAGTTTRAHRPDRRRVLIASSSASCTPALEYSPPRFDGDRPPS